MAKFKMQPTVDTECITARLGAGSGSANYVTDLELGKPVKLAGDSQYNLCAAGDQIEGFIRAVETWTADDFSIGSVQYEGRVKVTLDGLQATPGTGAIAVGDYVVAGTAVAKGTSLGTAYPKVCKATTQTGMYFAWRVVSLDGTTAVGQTATIERVNA
jgi:hypothetical protein